MAHIATDQERVLQELSIAAVDKLGHRKQVLDQRWDKIAFGSLVRDGTDFLLQARMNVISDALTSDTSKSASNLTLSNKHTVRILVSVSLGDNRLSVPVDSINPSIEQ